MARRLIDRGNIARDAGRHQLAGILYEEALRLIPGNGRIHIQCGHMMKEAGDFASAERHYLDALRLLPGDEDLALQLGHFYKMTERPDLAEDSYRRALDLRPGWVDAADELARIEGTLGAAQSPDATAHADRDWVVPELLPRGRDAPDRRLGQVEVRRLAPRWMRSKWGMMRVLRGVEAIRGFCLSATPITTVELLLDGEVVHTLAPQCHAVDGEEAAYRKYVFNLWHDFSGVPYGRYRVELRLSGPGAAPRVHRAHLLVAPPVGEHPGSDALVTVDPADPRSIEQQVENAPSMVRSAFRTALPDDIRTILVQRIDQLGDLVCSVPAIRRLRALFPEAQLIGLLSPANAPLGRTLGLFDAIVVTEFPMDPVEKRRVMPLAAQDKLRRALSAYRIDIAIDLCEASESRPALLLSGAPFLYGFKPREWLWLAGGIDAATRDPVNTLEMSPPSRTIMALVEALGAMKEGAAQAIRRAEIERARLAAYGIMPDDRYAVLHTGTRLGFNRWEGYPKLIDRLLQHTDLKLVVLTEGGSDAERAPNDRLVTMDGILPFDDFDALLSFCTVFVGNDSGPKHLASLRGAPTISLHTARTNWSEWGQEISGLIISRRVPCAGCGLVRPEECGKDFTCLRAIKVDEVFAAITRLVEAGMPRANGAAGQAIRS